MKIPKLPKSRYHTDKGHWIRSHRFPQKHSREERHCHISLTILLVPRNNGSPKHNIGLRKSLKHSESISHVSKFCIHLDESRAHEHIGSDTVGPDNKTMDGFAGAKRGECSTGLEGDGQSEGIGAVM